MTATPAIAIIFVIICVLYGWASHMYARKDLILEVEAGPLGHDCVLSNFESRSRVVRLESGRYVNTHDYIRVCIHGECMTPRNILNGEEWLVEPIRQEAELRSQLKERDVLLIYIQEKGLYKIRELEAFNPDGSLKTIYYGPDRVKRNSSRAHQASQVMGVVRYAI
ncbi:MAG: hypothetical protein NC039_08845 [Muribaculaceae bacterium]|nr:hypothetical protein [Muribaculaceae bacterium]